MYSASRSLRTVTLILFCGISSQAGFAQAVKLMRYEADPGPRAFRPINPPGCVGAETMAAELNRGGGAFSDAFVPCDTASKCHAGESMRLVESEAIQVQRPQGSGGQ
jgi:hypothetical protein